MEKNSPTKQTSPGPYCTFSTFDTPIYHMYYNRTKISPLSKSIPYKGNNDYNLFSPHQYTKENS